jgi:hypothetical protein
MATFLFCGGEGVLAQAPITGVIGTLGPRTFPVLAALTGNFAQSGLFLLMSHLASPSFSLRFWSISLF